jgi:hypothetical protein
MLLCELEDQQNTDGPRVSGVLPSQEVMECQSQHRSGSLWEHWQ